MADRRKFEEIVADIREELPELADELEQGYGKTALREQAGRVPELERERDELKARVEQLERAPARDKAFRAYGVDIENLRPAERRALEGYDGELDREAIAAFVEELELPLVPEGGEREDNEDQPPAAKVAAAARSAPASRKGQGPVITPEQVAEWPADKWMRFEEAHPEEADMILRGEEVVGIAFS